MNQSEQHIDIPAMPLPPQPPPEHEPDHCHAVELDDGRVIHVHGGNGEWTDRDREMFAEIVRAAERRYETERGDKQ